VEEAKRQFLLHIQYLFDTRTGLFFHGWTFEDGRHNFASALWGRGNSWLTIVLPEFIELLDLQPGDFLRTHLTNVLYAQCKALNKAQDKASGLWHTLLDDSSSYLEASASAGFVFGLLKAVRKRYIPKEAFEDVAVKGVKAVMANIDDKGELQQVSFGTPMGETKDFYKQIPLTSMPYGQAMAMMCLVEFLRVFY
jgi:unsaturated rhamnogalacturonyl hydrolase